MSFIRETSRRYTIKMPTLMTPSITAITDGWMGSMWKRFCHSQSIPSAAQVGRNIKSKSESPRPRISEITIITSVAFAPRCFLHHSVNLSSSSSMPSASADALSVFMLSDIISIKLTTPLIIGRFKRGFFFLTDTNSSSYTTMLPSSLRQVVTVLLPAFIITPSITA